MDHDFFKDRVNFLFEYARHLHQAGSPAHSLEATMKKLGDFLKLKTTFISIPTAIFGTIESQEMDKTKIIRVEPQGTNLGKLALVDNVAEEVIEHKVSLKEALIKLELIESFTTDYNPFLILLSYILLSMGMTTLLGGSWGDLWGSLIIGLMVGMISRLRTLGLVSQIMEVLVAFIVTLMASLLKQFSPDLNVSTLILSGLIILLPGLNITLSIAEIATQNLTSGTSRLMWGLMILMKLAFGVFIGELLAKHIHIRGVSFHFEQFPTSLLWITVPLTAWASAHALKALKKDALLVTIAGCFGFICSKSFTILLSQEAGLFMGGLFVGACANLYARFYKRPSSLFQLPGIILLVPGSMGYRSLSLLLDQNVVVGLNNLFSMVTIAFSLVMGVFVGNILIKPRGMVQVIDVDKVHH